MENPIRRALSVDEATKAADVGRTFIFQEIRKGRIRARKAGRRTIIIIDALDAWLKALPVKTGDGRVEDQNV